MARHQEKRQPETWNDFQRANQEGKAQDGAAERLRKGTGNAGLYDRG